jgi:hypothetical protein
MTTGVHRIERFVGKRPGNRSRLSCSEVTPDWLGGRAAFPLLHGQSANDQALFGRQSR